MDLLENIRIFKRVCELRSFSGAARELNVSQPTVSKAVRALERRLGVSLLRRTTRGLSLTTEGQKLLFSGGTLLEQADTMLASVANEKLQLQGALRVTASLAFARLILAPLFGEFTELNPGLRLSFFLSDGYVDLVENGIDLAIRIGEQADSTMKAVRVGISRRSLYASKDYIKKFGKPKSIEDLRNHRLLFYTRLDDRPCWPLTDARGNEEPFYFEPYFQSDGSDLLREAVVRGMGIALMPTWMMLEEPKKDSLVKLFERQSESPSPICVMMSGTQGMSAKQRVYTEFLLRHFGAMPELSLRQGARGGSEVVKAGPIR